MLDVEPKTFALEIAGTDLTVTPTAPDPPYVIKSLPNFDTFQVEAHNAGTVISEAYFSFLILTEDETSHGLTEGNLCSFTDGFYTYSFQLSDSPQPDMTGWSVIKTQYLGKENV